MQHPLTSAAAFGPHGAYGSADLWGSHDPAHVDTFGAELQHQASVRQRSTAEFMAPGNNSGRTAMPMNMPPPRAPSKLDHANPKVNPRAYAGAELLKVTSQQEFTVVWLSSSAAFVVTMLIWAHNFMVRPAFCIITSSFAIIYCICVLVMKKDGQHLYHPLAILGIVCVAAGSLTGLYLYDTYTIFPAFYDNTHTYYNVVPNQPANSVADAGKLTFASEAFVDVTQSAGVITEDGSIYCAAPIRDGTGISRLQFWAVGTGCCEALGKFTCDEVSNSDAHAGVIVFDNNNYFAPSRFTHYEKAREKAQATFALQSVSSVAYVRWVMEGDLDMLASQYRWSGRWWSMFFGVLGVIVFYVCTAFIYMPSAQMGAFQPMA